MGKNTLLGVSKRLVDVDEAGQFINIEVGAHKLKIVDAQDFPDDEYVLIYFDFIEGKLKDYFANRSKDKHPAWDFNGQVRVYYKERIH